MRLQILEVISTFRTSSPFVHYDFAYCRIVRVAREPELLIRVANASGSWSLKAPELWRAQLRTTGRF